MSPKDVVIYSIRFLQRRLKRILAGAAIVVFVLGIIGVLFHIRPPVIKASNIETFNNQIASNAPIVITFNQLMDRGSVEQGFKIFPQIGGRFEWSISTTTFIPEERFRISETYSVTIPGSVKNILGKPLGQDMILTFLVVDSPKVSLAVPNDETAVDSKITVMFSRPITEFTTYDVSESRDFPLQISPPVPGRFKWIGTAAFQYIPTDRLAYSTEYTATVPAGTPSLDGGKLDETFTFKFRTERIKQIGDLHYSNNINGKSPFILNFNQEVDLDSVREHVKITSKGDKEITLKPRYQKRKEVTYDDKGKSIEKEVEDKKIAELLPVPNDWGYDNSYVLNMTKGIAGIEGNLLSEDEAKDIAFNTDTFLTGKFPENDTVGANPSGDISLQFDQEVDLGSVRNNFTVSPLVDLKANYGKKCDPKWEPKNSPDEECDKVDNFTSVLFTPKEKLHNIQKYEVKLNKGMKAKNGLQYLKNDVSWNFTTADAFKILRTDPAPNGTGSYTHVCLFTNNLAEAKDLEKQFTFTPASKGKIWFSAYEVRLNDASYSYYDDQSDRCKPKTALEKYALHVSVLLDPVVRHTLTVKNSVSDTFGQKLASDFVLKFTTEALKDTDTSLEIIQPNFYATATLDQHAAPVIVARNLDNFDLEICRLSAEKFIDIDTEYARAEDTAKRYADFGFQALEPSETNCLDYKKTNKKLKRAYWQKQYAEVVIADELGAQPKPGYYFIRASSPKVYRIETDQAYDETLKYWVPKGERKIPVTPTQVLALTNLHLALKNSRDTGLFWVTDLATGKPVSGAEITLYSSKGTALTGVSITDKNGLARRDMHELPFAYALATKGSDQAVTDVNWADGISPWDYQLGYSQLVKYTQGYIYTDRPLYQPTHEVFFKGILRDDEDTALKIPQDKSIEVEITDSRGTSVYKKQSGISKSGIFADSFKLDIASPLGLYTISSCLHRNADGYCTSGIFQQFFSVEEYRKPEYKLDVTLSKDEYADKEQLNSQINANYFFGAPVSKGKVSWNIKAQNYYFDEYKDEWFSFTDYETFRKCYFGCPYDDQNIDSGEGVLDDSGKMTIQNKLDLSAKNENGTVKPPDSSKIYTVSATVQDKNNQSVAGRKEVIVHRGEFYVGVKNEAYVVSKGEKMPIKAIAVDHKGNPLNGKSIKLELYKTNWKYVKKKNIDGGYYWDNELDQKLIDSATVESGDDGKANYGFFIKEGGEYFVKATGQDSLGNTFGSTVDFYATTNESVHWKRENNNRMDLKLDKLTYEVGDTAKVLVKSPYANVKALVTYERGDIINAKVVDIASNAEVLEVPIIEKMTPNFYISVLEVKPGNKNDPPDFKLGYVNVVVNSKNKELVIAVKTDKERYQPREKVKIEIQTSDRSGKPVAADLSIAAVDASLLALKGNLKRDLLGVFYNNRSLGIYTADNLVNLLARINIADLQGTKGGSGKGADEFGLPRGKFEDTALWRSSVQTNSNGKAEISFILPDNLTTWNLEVIGSTDQSLFGDTNKTITTQKAVILRPVLPRFVLFQDKLRLGAIIHNFTGKSGRFTVDIEAKNLDVKGKKVQMVSIPSEGSAKITWETFAAKVQNGTLAEVTMTASGNDQQDAVAQKIPMYSYSTPETVALSSFTDDVSFTEKILLPSSVDPELGELKITTGATLATYLSDSLNYLLEYPYWCTEQIVSRLIPDVVIKNAVSLPNLQDKFKLVTIKDENGKPISFDVMVSQSLQKLYAYQRPDGGFGYFPGSRESYPALTAYTLFGFYQLQKAGYSVDGGAVSRASAFIEDYMKNKKDLKNPFTGKLREKDSIYANNRAYMLFVLEEVGRGDMGLSNSLYEDRKLLGNGGRAYLAMTLHALSPQAGDKIAVLMQGLENQARIDARGTYVRNDSGSSFEMMTNTKVTALTVQAFNRIQQTHPLLPKMVKWLIGIRKDGRWNTTQDTATALIALTEYLQKNKELSAKYKAKISLGGKVAKEYTVDAKTILDQKEVVREVSDLTLGGDGTKLVFTKDGTGRLYYDAVLRYFLPIDKIQPRSEGFNIERNYYHADDKKMEHPLTTVNAGETLRGHLTIIVPEERHAVSVENFLPAGFELINPEFETSDRTLEEQPDGKGGRLILDCYDCEYGSFSSGYFYGSSPWNHKEFRNDRLFLFADSLPKGVYEYDYFVQVASEGEFHHPPALVSEMYFPENFGRTRGEWMKVEESKN